MPGDAITGATLEQARANCKPGPLSIFVNKVLLTHNHTNVFLYCLQLFS